jgi:ADP-heptose:LPS heptosyltransferase
MKILLGNTGRGGELAVFTALIKAYRQKLPDATIHVTTCDNGVYGPLFQNSPDHNGWIPLQFRDKDQPNYLNPVGALQAYFRKTQQDYDHQEWACEFDFSPDRKKSNTGTILSNCYRRIKKKFFKLGEVPRHVYIYPTDEELKFAEAVFKKHGDDLVLVSHAARSASPIMNLNGYQQLCDKIARYHPVAFTGAMGRDPVLKGHIDLRGITFPALFAVSQKLGCFIGPDTATTWICAEMPGRLISIRGDRAYPLNNTGLVANGFRKGKDTRELDFHGRRPHQIIDQILPLVR